MKKELTFLSPRIDGWMDGWIHVDEEKQTKIKLVVRVV